MKAKLTLSILLLVASFSANAQDIPNGNFENWGNFSPIGWGTYEDFYGENFGLVTKDSVETISGQYSIKITSDIIPGHPEWGVTSGVCGLGNLTGETVDGPIFSGMPFPYRPDTIIYSLKYIGVNGDRPGMKLNLINLDFETGCYWNMDFTAMGPAWDWYMVVFPTEGMFINLDDSPARLTMEFYSSTYWGKGMGTQGSVLYVDNVMFKYVNLPQALAEIADKLKVSVYPNPASELLAIATDINTNGFRVVISDVSGRLIKSQGLETGKTTVNVSDFPGGTYIYRIADQEGNILKEGKVNVAR